MYCKTRVTILWKWNVLQSSSKRKSATWLQVSARWIITTPVRQVPLCALNACFNIPTVWKLFRIHLHCQRFSKNYTIHWVLLFSDQPLIRPQTCYLLNFWNRENLLGRHAVLLSRSNPKPLDRPMKVVQNLTMRETTSHSVRIHNGTVSKWCGRSFYWKEMSDISYKSFAEKVGPNNDLNMRQYILKKNCGLICHAVP